MTTPAPARRLAPALVATALLAAGVATGPACGEVEVTVLRAVPLDATPPDVVPPAECEGRLPVGAPCVESSACCSGVCGADPAGRLSCRSAVGCLGVGAECATASSCCSLSCREVARVDGVGVWRCVEDALCASRGEACSDGRDCCSGRCNAGTCELKPAECLVAGERCGKHDSCCGRVCVDLDAPDDKPRCALLPACRAVGELCLDAGDCCSGACERPGEDPGRCVALGLCATPDFTSCALQAGDVCELDNDCCTRRCRPGVNRCGYAGGCRLQCELCTADAECCSGQCTDGGEGVLRCAAASPGCVAEGEACAAGVDCCPAGADLGACFDDPIPVERCHSGAMDAGACLAEQAPCALPGACCSGVCVPPPEGGALRCAGGKLADGERCTASSDCAGGAESDCLPLEGRPTCVPVAP